MNDVYVSFKDTGREGSMAVGNYLIDAAKQLGVDLDCDCKGEDPGNLCAVKVMKGGALLSKRTKFENEQLSSSERKDRQRLACNAKIEKPGEIELMVVKKKEDEAPETEEKKDHTKEFTEEFKDLPLSKKFASLVELEAIALGETISYVINSPYEAAGKVMEAMAGFGRDLEEKDREAKVPDEHRPEGDEEAEAQGEAAAEEEEPTPSGKSKASKKPAAKGRAAKGSTPKQRQTRRRRKAAPKKKEDDADK